MRGYWILKLRGVSGTLLSVDPIEELRIRPAALCFSLSGSIREAQPHNREINSLSYEQLKQCEIMLLDHMHVTNSF